MPNLEESLKKSLIELIKRPYEKSQPWCHRTKIFYIFVAEEQVKRVFTPAPLVSFRSGYSFRNHGVRVKVYSLIRQKSTFSCGKSRCETYCDLK